MNSFLIVVLVIYKIEITQVEVNEYGFFNVADVIESIKENTILISIMLANNETGVIQVKLFHYSENIFNIN
jgi:cysteine sulfinate desulfinase/cysteine desulfurase-like protein